MPSVSYPYTAGSLLDCPQSYMYSSFHGEAFILSWRESRRVALRTLYYPALSLLPCFDFISPVSTISILSSICHSLREGEEQTEPNVYWLQRLVRKFEVTKRIYDGYEVEVPHKPMPNAKYRDLSLYLLLAECLIRHCLISPNIQYLNCLLKLNDTLISQKYLLDGSQSAHLSWILEAELHIVSVLMSKVGVEYV